MLVSDFVNARSSCLETLQRKIELAERWLKIEIQEAEERLAPGDLIKAKYKLQEECSDYMNLSREVDDIKHQYRGKEDFEQLIDKMVNHEIHKMQDYVNTSDYLDDPFMQEFELDQTRAGETAKAELRLERAIAQLRAPYVPEEGNTVTLVGVTCIAILVAIIIWF